MITAIERLAAVAGGVKTDRIPIFCNLLDQGAKELGMTISEYYSRGEYVAEGQLRMREKYGYDNLWSLFYVGKEAELLGCRKIVYAKDGPPNVGDMFIKDYDDIYNLQIPDDIIALQAFEEQRKCLEILKREAGGKYPICAYLTASMTLPALLMGMEKWMELLFTGPAEVRDLLLSKCSDFFKKELTAFKNAGADILLYSNPFASTDFVSMNIFDSLSLKWMQNDLNSVGTDGVVFYCGGARLEQTMQQVMVNIGVKSFYLSPLDNISSCRSKVGVDALCAGVINDIKLIDWSVQEVREETKKIIGEGKDKGNFMFGTLVMPYEIPEVNIRNMIEAAFEYGSF